MSPWVIGAVALIAAGWVWVLRDPLLRGWRALALLAAATVVIVAGGLILEPPADILVGGLLGAAIAVVLIRYPDRISSLSPTEWRFANTLVAIDDEIARLAHLDDNRISYTTRVSRLEEQLQRMNVAEPPDADWGRIKALRVEELVTAIELLRTSTVDAESYRRLQTHRHQSAAEFKALIHSRARFGR